MKVYGDESLICTTAEDGTTVECSYIRTYVAKLFLSSMKKLRHAVYGESSNETSILPLTDIPVLLEEVREMLPNIQRTRDFVDILGERMHQALKNMVRFYAI